MNDLEAIALRISRRSYTGGVPEKDVRPLQDMAAAFGEDYGLHLYLEPQAEALFAGFAKSYGMFTGVQSIFVLAGPQADAHGGEKAGHAGERLVLECTKRGLGTCWVGGTFDRKTLATALPAGHTVHSVITVGSVPGGQTGREKFIYRLAHRGTKSIEELYTADDAVPDWFLQGMKAVQKAPSAVNAQPVAFSWRGGVITAAVENPRPMQLVDLGIAKLHFELAAGGRFELGNGARFNKT